MNVERSVCLVTRAEEMTVLWVRVAGLMVVEAPVTRLADELFTAVLVVM